MIIGERPDVKILFAQQIVIIDEKHIIAFFFGVERNNTAAFYWFCYRGIFTEKK
jgi:hypothetical protein